MLIRLDAEIFMKSANFSVIKYQNVYFRKNVGDKNGEENGSRVNGGSILANHPIIRNNNDRGKTYQRTAAALFSSFSLKQLLRP